MKIKDWEKACYSPGSCHNEKVYKWIEENCDLIGDDDLSLGSMKSSCQCKTKFTEINGYLHAWVKNEHGRWIKRRIYYYVYFDLELIKAIPELTDIEKEELFEAETIDVRGCNNCGRWEINC